MARRPRQFRSKGSYVGTGVRTEGFEELDRKLAELRGPLVKRILKNALTAALEPLQAMVQAAAPHGDGHGIYRKGIRKNKDGSYRWIPAYGGGRLKDGVRIAVRILGTARRKLPVDLQKMAGRGDGRISAIAGLGYGKDKRGQPSYARHAHLIEYGHKARDGSWVPGRPFFGPIWQAQKSAVLERLAGLVWAEIKTVEDKQAKAEATRLRREARQRSRTLR